MQNKVFDRGDIIWLDCDPQSGRRPMLVVSNRIVNSKRRFAYVCPITNTNKNDPFHVPLDGRTKTTGVVLADQMRSLDMISRNPQYIERAPNDLLEEVVDIIAGFIEAQ